MSNPNSWAGTIPYGLSLSPPIPPPGALNADLLDYQGSGTIQTARYIDPVTQDFALSSDGLYEGMNYVDQQIQVALATTFNSTSVLGFGQNFNRQTVPVITPYITRTVTNLLNQALADLLNANLITLSNVSIAANQQGQVFLNFTFQNLSLNTQTTINYLVPSTNG